MVAFDDIYQFFIQSVLPCDTGSDFWMCSFDIMIHRLSKVMEESSSLAYTVAKAELAKRQPENRFFEHAAIHLHVPEGATPKDGPSAGITMTTSLLSLAMGRPVRQATAMTGELTLSGKVLRIGGLKEKTIAAKRAGVTHVLFPKANEADWAEWPEHVKAGLVPHPVDTYEEVFSLCFEGQ